MADAPDLHRFLAAQVDSYERALAELERGRKESHWMWFVFPQLAGLGHSAMSRRYAIASAQEARRYLAHSLLGSRLVECTSAVLAHRHRPIDAILGSVDALKFRSSMTLFEAVAGAPEQCFGDALRAFYDGEPDSATLRLLR